MIQENTMPGEPLTKEQLINYNEIELRVILQQAIEILDFFKANKTKFKNQSLHAQLKALYPALDKDTRKYDEMFNATEEGTTVFYDIVKGSSSLIMTAPMPKKAIFNQFVAAYNTDEKAVQGIINKTLKDKYFKQ